MNPNPQPTRLERAAEFDIAAGIAHTQGNYVFAQELSSAAHHLRMEESQNATGRHNHCTDVFCRCRTDRGGDHVDKCGE